jgi:hypothetical protein
MLLVAGALTDARQEWVAAGSKGGVALAFRDDPQLGAREMRATAELPHAADRIAAVVCDFTQVLDRDVREARVVSGDLASDYQIYLRYAPRYVVVAARDVVIDVSRTATGCTWSERQDAQPAHRGIVRMPLLRGAWIIEPLDTARSRVVYQIAVNPGGSIPGWLVRRGAADALPEVIGQVARCLSTTTGPGARCSPE